MKKLKKLTDSEFAELAKEIHKAWVQFDKTGKWQGPEMTHAEWMAYRRWEDNRMNQELGIMPMEGRTEVYPEGWEMEGEDEEE